jgi:membrane associated rhomboid family serine protease
MKRLFRNFFTSLPWGARLLVLVYALAFPVALAGHYTHAFDLYNWLGLSPALTWKGQVWRVVTYGFLPAGPIDWALGTFWLATLVSVVGRNWSSPGLWAFCALGIFAGAVPIVLFKPSWEFHLAGGAAMVFALLVAWDWLYRKERLLLLGIGEISARQAALLIAFINSLVLFFCSGWFIMVSMWCGGLVGYLWLIIRAKLFLGKSPQQIRSERVARLEI